MANLESFINKTKAKAINDKVTQRVLASIHVDIDERIFKNGKDSKGQLIGTYSKAYQARRRSGYYWYKKGVPAKTISYPPSTKVILQATSAMNNDFKFGVFNGKYGSGFSNDINFNKSEWVENTYNKEIFKITNKEDKDISKRLDKELNNYLKKL